MIKIEEKLDEKDKYSIFINEENVFSINVTNEQDPTFKESLNVLALLERVYQYGLQHEKVTFGIK